MDALALVESPSHVCCRYRIEPFAERARALGHRVEVAGLEPSPLARLRQLSRAADFDVVVLQRKLLGAMELAWLRRRSRRLVFDFDDAVFARDSYDARGAASGRRSRRFGRTARAADLMLAGNEFLMARAVLAGAEPARVRAIPTCIDPARYAPRADTVDPGALTLVWIGSSSTVRGLEQRAALWAQIAERFPGVRLRLICDRFPELGLPTEAVAWSAANEAAMLASADVGIALVPDDVWSRGKCGLKVLQYMAAGLPVIANPVGVHTDLIEPGASGFLAASDDDWLRAIGELASDPALRARMGRAGRERVEAAYSVDAWADRWVEAVFGAPREPSGPRADHGERGRPSPHRARVVSRSLTRGA